MKIVCINNTIGNSRYFKIEQIVEARELNKEERDKMKRLKHSLNYYVINSNQFETLKFFRPEPLGLQVSTIWCKKECFISIEEFREIKLNKLI